MQGKRLKVFRFLLLAGLALLVSRPVFAQEAEEKPAVWAPDKLTSEIQVKAAYNGQDIFWLFEWKVEDGGNLFHDVLVYEDGAWVTRGDGGDGADEFGLREDRLILMVDSGAVSGFANQGCYVACHSGQYSLSDAHDKESVLAALGEDWGRNDIRKYIPASRNGDLWWSANWNNPKSGDELAALVEAGVFLDMWHWRSVRSGPIGYSDDQHVLEYRNSDAGKSSVSTNWDGDAKQPRVMFDPAQTGIYALNWDKLMAGEYTQEDVYYLYGGNSVPFDPNHAWKNGDVIPRRTLRTPEGGLADIEANGRLSNGAWQLEMRRAMDSADPTDHALAEGRLYNIGIAVHQGATGSRWHYITMPLKLGVGVGADVTAVRFSGSAPDWNSITAVTLPVYYPGEITWDWLTSDAHPGAPEIRADDRSCQSCHGGDAASVAKLAQASVFHEKGNTGFGLNWWLTLAAGLVLLSGGSVTALNLSGKKEK
jgi:hypothetical protein